MIVKTFIQNHVKENDFIKSHEKKPFSKLLFKLKINILQKLLPLIYLLGYNNFFSLPFQDSFRTLREKEHVYVKEFSPVPVFLHL